MTNDDIEKIREVNNKYMPPPPWPSNPGGTRTPNVNWMDTLDSFTLISGGLVGFTLVFVTTILGWSVAHQPISPLFPAITWGDIGVLLNGVSAVLFINAAEFLTTAKQFNTWSLPSGYESWLSEQLGKENWEKLKPQARKNMLRYEELGRLCYNSGLLFMFGAFFFVICPYNLAIAIFISLLGAALQILQMVTMRLP